MKSVVGMIKDERPQGLSWQSALKGYYTILWQKYKNRFFRFFSLWKWFWYYLRVRARKTWSEKIH